MVGTFEKGGLETWIKLLGFSRSQLEETIV